MICWGERGHAHAGTLTASPLAMMVPTEAELRGVITGEASPKLVMNGSGSAPPLMVAELLARLARMLVRQASSSTGGACPTPRTSLTSWWVVARHGRQMSGSDISSTAESSARISVAVTSDSSNKRSRLEGSGASMQRE